MVRDTEGNLYFSLRSVAPFLVATVRTMREISPGYPPETVASLLEGLVELEREQAGLPSIEQEQILSMQELLVRLLLEMPPESDL